MKIIVNTLTGKCINFDLNNDATIGDLRTKLETALDMSSDKFHISSIVGRDNQRLCVIYSDDPADAILLDFLKSQTNNAQLQIEELKINTVRNLGPAQYRRSKSTENGIDVGIISELKNAFFSPVSVLRATAAPAAEPATPAATTSGTGFSCTIQ